MIYNNKKHLVYAEDVIHALMQHPDNMIYKYEIRRLVDEVVRNKEVSILNFISKDNWSDDEGDLYD